MSQQPLSLWNVIFSKAHPEYGFLPQVCPPDAYVLAASAENALEKYFVHFQEHEGSEADEQGERYVFRDCLIGDLWQMSLTSEWMIEVVCVYANDSEDAEFDDMTFCLDNPEHREIVRDVLGKSYHQNVRCDPFMVSGQDFLTVSRLGAVKIWAASAEQAAFLFFVMYENKHSLCKHCKEGYVSEVQLKNIEALSYKGGVTNFYNVNSNLDSFRTLMFDALGLPSPDSDEFTALVDTNVLPIQQEGLRRGSMHVEPHVRYPEKRIWHIAPGDPEEKTDVFEIDGLRVIDLNSSSEESTEYLWRIGLSIGTIPVDDAAEVVSEKFGAVIKASTASEAFVLYFSHYFDHSSSMQEDVTATSNAVMKSGMYTLRDMINDRGYLVTQTNARITATRLSDGPDEIAPPAGTVFWTGKDLLKVICQAIAYQRKNSFKQFFIRLMTKDEKSRGSTRCFASSARNAAMVASAHWCGILPRLGDETFYRMSYLAVSPYNADYDIFQAHEVYDALASMVAIPDTSASIAIEAEVEREYIQENLKKEEMEKKKGEI